MKIGIFERLITLLNFILLGMVWLILPGLARGTALPEVYPSGRAFVYMHYLGEQAKPFPLLILTPIKGKVTAELQHILDNSLEAARHYTLPKQQFFEAWKFLACEYRWQDYRLPLRGQDFYEVVLWEGSPKQTFMSREEMLHLLQHILALIRSSNPNLSGEINALVRRLSN